MKSYQKKKEATGLSFQNFIYNSGKIYWVGRVKLLCIHSNGFFVTLLFLNCSANDHHIQNSNAAMVGMACVKNIWYKLFPYIIIVIKLKLKPKCVVLTRRLCWMNQYSRSMIIQDLIANLPIFSLVRTGKQYSLTPCYKLIVITHAFQFFIT